MKPLLLVFLTLLSLTAGTDLHAKERQTITLYIDSNYPPYSYMEKSRLKGVYVDKLYEIARYLESYVLVLQPVPWQRGKKLMEDGEGLALAPPYFHGHDWPYLYPYSLAFGEEVIGVVCQNKSVPLDPKRWPEDFKKYSFASITGYDGWGGDTFHKLVTDKHINYTEVASTRLLLHMVLNGRVDCILAELNALEVKLAPLKAKKEASNIRIVREIGRDEVYVGFSEKAMASGKFPYAQHFKKELDIAIYKWKKANQ